MILSKTQAKPGKGRMTDFSPKSVIRWGLDFWGKVVSENAHWIQEMEH